MKLRETKGERGGLLSDATINQCLATLKIMLGEAVRLGYLANSPADHVEGLKEHSREKSILSDDEVKALFDEKGITKVWARDVRHYTINLLAAATGMRMGEVQALQVQHVHSDHVLVCHGWERKYGLKEPKWGSAREIPIPTMVATHLLEVVSISPYQEPEDLIFWGVDRRSPIQHREIEMQLYAAMDAIGVKQDERRRRNVSFHSWRHFFNTRLRAAGITDAKIQKVTGHKTQAMTEHYSHLALENFKDVLAVSEAMFS